MNLYRIIPFFFVLGACTPKKEIAHHYHSSNMDKVEPPHTMKCGNTPIEWTLFTDDVSALYSGQYLPTKFNAYTLKSQQIAKTFEEIKSGKTNEISLPLNGKCITFVLRPSNTLSPELAEQYPQLLSFQGTNKDNVSETASIDYDGLVLKVYARLNDGIFIIDPVKIQSGFVYLEYNRQESTIPKSPLESKSKSNH